MNIKIKKVIAAFFTGLILASLPYYVKAEEGGSGEKRKLLVTAYYSPLPDQTFYIRGSYEADIRLNGRGTNGADGTPVFTGMLAAPKTYPFGTAVLIPGLGFGEVHDRGGAILATKDYDRIDVWMGKGEEGLSRALNWGARLVEGEVYFPPHQVDVNLNFNWVKSQLPPAFISKISVKGSEQSPSDNAEPETTPSDASPSIEKETEVLTPEQAKEFERLEQNRTLLAAGLGKDSTGEEVRHLQRMLWELGYYQGEINGNYDEATMSAVFDFQVDHDILKSEADQGAGYFGKKTLDALLSILGQKIKVLAHYPVEVHTWVPAKQVLPKIASLKIPEVTIQRQSLQFIADSEVNKKIVQNDSLKSILSLNEQGEQVKVLQRFLIDQGFLDAGLDTGYFGKQTQAAVIKFQLKQGIITSPSSGGAGVVGPQTLAAINSF